MTKRKFRALCKERWREVAALFPELRHKVIPIEFGDYDHFHTPRGFGVTFCDEDECSMRYPLKLLRQPVERIDGVIRHELGHVVDHLLPLRLVNERGLAQGIRIPVTVERRADAIAWAIWGVPLRYDRQLVQSTRFGTHPRPRHLGL